jgi:hypothetical protein
LPGISIYDRISGLSIGKTRQTYCFR